MGPFKVGWLKSDVESVIERGDVDELGYVPIVVSMDPPDCDWAVNICLGLSSHPDARVRGNSVLGFGHLARICGHLDRSSIQPVIIAALSDSDSHVRGHAQSAVDDTSHFLDWDYSEIDAD